MDTGAGRSPPRPLSHHPRGDAQVVARQGAGVALRWVVAISSVALMSEGCSPAPNGNREVAPVQCSGVFSRADDVIWHDELGLNYSLHVESLYMSFQEVLIRGSICISN